MRSPGSTLARERRDREHARTMRFEPFNYIECSIPEGMTVSQYRRSRPRRRRSGLRRLVQGSWTSPAAA